MATSYWHHSVGYSRKKKKTGGLRAQFPGLLRNSIWSFQEFIKKQVKIPKSRQSCVNKGF